MGKVIDLQAKRQAKTDQDDLARLLTIADQFDRIILESLEKGTIQPRDLAGLLAHRLGTLISHFDNKQQILDICVQVLNKQARLDDRGA